MYKSREHIMRYTSYCGRAVHPTGFPLLHRLVFEIIAPSIFIHNIMR